MKLELVHDTIEGMDAGGLCRDRIASVSQRSARPVQGLQWMPGESTCDVMRLEQVQSAWHRMAKMTDGVEGKDSGEVRGWVACG